MRFAPPYMMGPGKDPKGVGCRIAAAASRYGRAGQRARSGILVHGAGGGDRTRALRLGGPRDNPVRARSNDNARSVGDLRAHV